MPRASVKLAHDKKGHALISIDFDRQCSGGEGERAFSMSGTAEQRRRAEPASEVGKWSEGRQPHKDEGKR